MGTCCFTPRKTHFLWWYWLALTAVLGVPMLLAAGYARLRRSAPEADHPRIARASAKLFWVSLVLVLLLAGVLVEVFFGLAAKRASSGNLANDYQNQYPVTLTQLATDFVLGFAVAGVGWRIARRFRRSWQHVAVAVAASLAWMILAVPVEMVVAFPPLLSLMFFEPGEGILLAQGFLMFGACWLAAHFWCVFRELPTRRTAWRAVVALVAAAILFQVFAQYGTWWHYHWYRATHTRWNPPAAEHRYRTW